MSFPFPLSWLKLACGDDEPSLAVERGSYGSRSQTFWSYEPVPLLETEDPKELLFTWVISINIYCIKNEDIIKYVLI